MTAESRKASQLDSEEEKARVARSGVDEDTEQLEAAARAFGMSVKDYLEFMSTRPNSGRFGTDKDLLNPKNRTQKTSATSGTVFNTSNWDPAFKFGSRGKRKNR